MTCKEFIEFLYDYVSGDLSCEQRAAFDEHMSICPDCVDYVNTYRKTVELTRASADDAGERDLSEVPKDLIRAIMDVRKQKP